MTNEQKLQLLKETEYAYFNLEIEERDGVIYVNDYHHGDMYPLDEIVLFDFGNEVNLPIHPDTLHDHYVQCNDCGMWLERDGCETTWTDDSNVYCEYCLENNATYCDYHNSWEEHDDFYEVNVGQRYPETWCENAVNNNAFWSEYNERYYSYDHYDSVTVYGTDCEWVYEATQANEYAYLCEECNEYFTEDAFNLDTHMCHDCTRQTQTDRGDTTEVVGGACVNSYHHSKDNGTLHFFGESKYVNPVGTGFELEVDTTSSNARENQQKLLVAIKQRFGDRVTFERDGSLCNGFEIISAPHTKSEMENVNWAELLQLCTEHGYKSHDYKTCGLHFHVSGYMFGATKEKQHDNIAKVIAFYNHFYDDFVKLSRRPSEWNYSAEHWADKYGVYFNGDMNEYKNECKKIVKNYATIRWYGERYHAINLTNVDLSTNLFNTVEFRINRGTLNPNTFYASYDMIVTMIKNAKKMDWNSPDFFNPKKWFSGCKPNTYAYIVKRNAFEGVFYLAQANNDTEYTQENA